MLGFRHCFFKVFSHLIRTKSLAKNLVDFGLKMLPRGRLEKHIAVFGRALRLLDGALRLLASVACCPPLLGLGKRRARIFLNFLECDSHWYYSPKIWQHGNKFICIHGTGYKYINKQMKNRFMAIKGAITKELEGLKLFRQAIENAFDHIVVTDADGKILFANKAVTRITGYLNKEIIGGYPSLWKSPKTPHSFYRKFWTIIKHDKKLFKGEIVNRRKYGEMYTAEISVSPILGPKNKLIGFLGVERDITKQKTAQEELQRSEEKYRSLFEKMLEGFALHELVYNLNGKPVDYRFVEVNPAFERMTGLKRGKIIGRTAREIFPGMEKAGLERYFKVAQTGKPIVFQDNSKAMKKWFNVNAFSTKKGTFAILFNDITDERLANRKIEMFNEELKKEVEMKTRDLVDKNRRLAEHEKKKNEFLINIGHELKTPLAIIEMNIETMKKNQAPKHARKESELVIRRNMHRLKTKIEEIIQLSRLEKGGAPRLEQTDLRPIIEGAVRTYRDFARAKGIRIFFKKTKTALPMQAEPRLIAYTINNLLSNAVKFTKKGSVTLQAKIIDGNIVISVADTGKGVQQKDEANIFTRFYKADPTGPGTGVGLYIAKQIAQKHGGNMSYKKNRPKGSVFIITLPMQRQ